MSLNAGERVRHWRKLREIEQKDLAAKAKVDPARLCRIELGKTEARADELERLATALDLTMSQFYGAIEEARAS